MALGMLFAMTLPGLVVVLVVLAGVEVALSRRGRRGLLSGSARPSVSASGLDVSGDGDHAGQGQRAGGGSVAPSSSSSSRKTATALPPTTLP